MKRTYEVLKVHALPDDLLVVVQVSEIGACWFINIRVPWPLLLEPKIQQALGGAQAAAVARCISMVEQGLWE